MSEQGKLEGAIAEYREAIRLKPDHPIAHTNLGLVLHRQGKLGEAIVEYREALRLNPEQPKAHVGLGALLCDAQRDFEGAVAEFREAIRLEPDDPEAHGNLGNALNLQGKLDEAIAEYREAVRLKPDHLEAHANIGFGLRSRGDYAGAVAELRKACDLARATNPRRAEQLEPALAETEQRASRAARLPGFLAGKTRPADAADALAFAQICYEKRVHGASARFWTEAFQAQPKLAEDMKAQHRYNAACAAALAGCGQGKDVPPLDDATRARWRKQALDWLKADLATWSKILESAPPQVKPSIAQTLQHWKADPDLAGLRDPGSLDKLPKDEQDVCRGLWKGVDALLAKAGGNAR